MDGAKAYREELETKIKKLEALNKSMLEALKEARDEIWSLHSSQYSNTKHNAVIKKIASLIVRIEGIKI